MTTHTLGADQPHYAWDNSLSPALEIEPGDTVVPNTLNCNAPYYSPSSTSADAARRPPFRGHVLTGPIRVTGARPGSTLVVDILDVQPADWAFTAIYPEKGLLPEDFSNAYLRIWDLSDGKSARGLPGVTVPLAPFCGVMGVALAEPGAHSTVPPRRVGGNMDVKQLTAGSTLYLPIEVEGALFSAGDAHGVQGDGEVCVTAVEMDSVTTLRFDVRHNTAIREPQVRLPGPPTVLTGPYHGCMAHTPDLMDAAQQAIRYLIDWICQAHDLKAQDAYVLCSVAAELRISQVVDPPNWTVTAFLPLSIFD